VIARVAGAGVGQISASDFSTPRRGSAQLRTLAFGGARAAAPLLRSTGGARRHHAKNGRNRRIVTTP